MCVALKVFCVYVDNIVHILNSLGKLDELCFIVYNVSIIQVGCYIHCIIQPPKCHLEMPETLVLNVWQR